MGQVKGCCKISGVRSTSECQGGVHTKGKLAKVLFNEEVDQIHNPRLEEGVGRGEATKLWNPASQPWLRVG